MPGKFVAPAIELTAFCCPFCQTLTSQYWYKVHVDPLAKNVLPNVWTQAEAEERIKEAVVEHEDDPDRTEALHGLREHLQKLVLGLPFFHGDDEYVKWRMQNVHASRCHECSAISLWLHNNLLWPASSTAPEANADLPADVSIIYREAAAVLSTSPRAAAALLRLCIELLCKSLGCTGDDLNQNIGALVARGLDPRVEKALDIVRVVGNEAVHPGHIDPDDDRPAAEELFRLVNLIAEIMISQPKHIDEMYSSIPPAKRAAIEKRNAKAIAAPKPGS